MTILGFNLSPFPTTIPECLFYVLREGAKAPVALLASFTYAML